MTGPAARSLTDAERARLAKIADIAFPRTSEMPSASDVGLAERLVDRALNAVPSLTSELREALAKMDGADEAAFLALRDTQPTLFKSFMLVMGSAYFMSPDVRDRIGYHGQEAKKIDIYEVPEYLEDGRLERVIERGPLWIDAPGEEGPRTA